MSESELERELQRRGQWLVRGLLQEHHGQRGPGETNSPAEDASGVECSEPRVHDSHTETTSDARHQDGLQPPDAALNLLPERNLFAICRVPIATASRAPPRTSWKPRLALDIHGGTSDVAFGGSLPARRRACRHAVRELLVLSRNGQPAPLMQPKASTKSASPSGP